MSLNGRIEMIAGPLDRPDLIARAVRWWLAALPRPGAQIRRQMIAAEAVGAARRRAGHPAIVTLDDHDCFIADVTLPPGSPEAHRRAIALRLEELAPVRPDTLSIAAIATRRSDAGTTYAIAMARDARLQQIRKRSKDAGARIAHFAPQDATHIAIRDRAQTANHRRSVAIDGGLSVALALVATLGVQLWTGRIEADAEQIAARERDARRAVVAIETVRNDAELAQALTTGGVLKRRPGAALDALANINAATPDAAWWTSLRWSPDETLVSAQSSDATEALRLLSQDALRWSVELAGPISTSPANETQSLEVRFTLRQADPS